MWVLEKVFYFLLFLDRGCCALNAIIMQRFADLSMHHQYARADTHDIHCSLMCRAWSPWSVVVCVPGHQSLSITYATWSWIPMTTHKIK